MSAFTASPWSWRAGGLLAGALLIFLTPGSWLFVVHEDDSSSASAGDGTRWACPMFCVIMEEQPENGRCPVCGMALQAIQGQATVDEHERFMSGVVGEALQKRELEIQLRQIGEIDYDESLLSSVASRVDGILERVAVSETWTRVEAGQVLVEIDSPLLYSAQGDYLVAWRSAGRPEHPGSETGPAARTLHSTTRRLLNLGLGEPELAELRSRDEALDPIALRAPRAGVVIRRKVVEGQGVKTGQELFAIADLSRVWIQLEIFEHELAWVTTGQKVELRVDSLPGESQWGTVSFIDPVVDRVRRIARVRVVADNPMDDRGRRLLLPGQRVDARIRARLGRKSTVALPDPNSEEPYAGVPALLAIPREAVLRTGERDVTFVLYAEDSSGQRSYELDPNRLPKVVGYELVELRLGPKARAVGDDAIRWYYPVLGVATRKGEAGLARLRPGHVVASDGAFLLDSQAQLAGRPSLLFPEGSRSASDDPHADH